MLILFGTFLYLCNQGLAFVNPGIKLSMLCRFNSFQGPIFLALVSVQWCPNWILTKFFSLQVYYPFKCCPWTNTVVPAIFVYLKQRLAFQAANIVYILLFCRRWGILERKLTFRRMTISISVWRPSARTKADYAVQSINSSLADWNTLSLKIRRCVYIKLKSDLINTLKQQQTFVMSSPNLKINDNGKLVNSPRPCMSSSRS